MLSMHLLNYPKQKAKLAERKVQKKSKKRKRSKDASHHSKINFLKKIVIVKQHDKSYKNNRKKGGHGTKLRL